MQTDLAAFIKDTPEGREADAILRKCVHCGFCTATCPTYQVLGDELDGPRGRIYLIKRVLEGAEPTTRTQLHLDRCLTCRACETTCPSGVRYGRLVDIGRHEVDKKIGRRPVAAAMRRALRLVLLQPAFFQTLLNLGRAVRSLLPESLSRKIPRGDTVPSWPTASHRRTMLVLDGCVQPGLSPNTNAAAARLLDRLGITLKRAPQSGCCGALSFHMDAHDEAHDYMRRNVDAWWPHVEQGAEAIVTTASACGLMVKDYGYQLAGDPAYAEKAKRISDLTRDIGEILLAEKQKLSLISQPPGTRGRVALHSPCTLQHGLKLKGKVENLLGGLGYELTTVPDAHLCCGSAGTYSILQPRFSRQLREHKIAALESGKPAAILTANIGCQAHLQGATELPVKHWIEALDEACPP